MIGIRLPYFYCLAFGEESSEGPTGEEIQAHMDRVYRGSCDHAAAELNGRLELVTCPLCAG